MANATQITVLDSASATATVSTLDAFIIGTGVLAANFSQLNGVAVSTASGAMDTGTMRMALAINSPGVVALGQVAMASSLPVAIANNQSALTVANNTAALLNATVIGTTVVSGTVTVANATASLLNTKEIRSGTGILTNVVSTTTPVAILASNAGRLGASVFNNSTATLCMLLTAGTATTTAFSVALNSNSYFEVPFNYTGAINGVWSTTAVGTASITEYT